MRLVVVLHSAKPSGAELATTQYILEWSQFQTTVLLFEDGPIADRLREGGVEVRVLAKGEFGAVKRSASLIQRLTLAKLLLTGWRLSHDLSPDLVIAHSVKSALVAAPLAGRSRVPFVWSVHDMLSTQYFGRVNAAIYRLLVRCVPQAVIVNSRSTLGTLGRLRRPVLIRPPGVHSGDSWSPRPVRSSTDFRFLMLGRLSPWKGQALFLSAFAQVFRGRPDVRAEIAGAALFGESDYLAGLKAQVQQLGLEQQVHFLGHVDDPRGLVRECDVLVHASLIPEPFGAVVTEGMAAGAPVVAADAGGPSEVITSGVDGILFESGNADSLAGALSDLYGDAGLRDRLCRAAAETVEIYTYDRLAPAAAEWLERVSRGRMDVPITDLTLRPTRNENLSPRSGDM